VRAYEEIVLSIRRCLETLIAASFSTSALANRYIADASEGGGGFSAIVLILALYVALDAWGEIQKGLFVGWLKAAGVCVALFAVFFYGIYIELLGLAGVVIVLAGMLIAALASFFRKLKTPPRKYDPPALRTSAEWGGKQADQPTQRIMSDHQTVPVVSGNLIPLNVNTAEFRLKAKGTSTEAVFNALLEWRRNLLERGRSGKLLPDEVELMRIAEIGPVISGDVIELIHTKLSEQDAYAIANIVATKRWLAQVDPDNPLDEV
jgi:hypothetical protein